MDDDRALERSVKDASFYWSRDGCSFEEGTSDDELRVVGNAIDEMSTSNIIIIISSIITRKRFILHKITILGCEIKGGGIRIAKILLHAVGEVGGIGFDDFIHVRDCDVVDFGNPVSSGFKRNLSATDHDGWITVVGESSSSSSRMIAANRERSRIWSVEEKRVGGEILFVVEIVFAELMTKKRRRCTIA